MLCFTFIFIVMQSILVLCLCIAFDIFSRVLEFACSTFPVFINGILFFFSIFQCCSSSCFFSVAIFKMLSIPVVVVEMSVILNCTEFCANTSTSMKCLTCAQKEARLVYMSETKIVRKRTQIRRRVLVGSAVGSSQHACW